MVKLALYGMLKAKPGKEAEVEAVPEAGRGTGEEGNRAR